MGAPIQEFGWADCTGELEAYSLLLKKLQQQQQQHYACQVSSMLLVINAAAATVLYVALRRNKCRADPCKSPM